MKELIREAALGQIIRFVSGNRLLRYPEEEPDFQIPFERIVHQRKLSEINKEIDVESDSPSPAVEEAEELDRAVTAEDRGDNVDMEKAETNRSRAGLEKLTSVRSIARTQTIPFTRERFEADQILAAQRTLSLPIEPTVTSTGQILVTWYTTDDQDNPQNWSQKKKSYVSFLIWYVLAIEVRLRP
jgi:DHA1 family multidrug resistance protein-like MFS transporter